MVIVHLDWTMYWFPPLEFFCARNANVAFEWLCFRVRKWESNWDLSVLAYAQNGHLYSCPRRLALWTFVMCSFSLHASTQANSHSVDWCGFFWVWRYSMCRSSLLLQGNGLSKFHICALARSERMQREYLFPRPENCSWPCWTSQCSRWALQFGPTPMTGYLHESFSSSALITCRRHVQQRAETHISIRPRRLTTTTTTLL